MTIRKWKLGEFVTILAWQVADLNLFLDVIVADDLSRQTLVSFSLILVVHARDGSTKNLTQPVLIVAA